MKKWLTIAVAGLLGLLIGVLGLEIVASESGEVVVLSVAADGGLEETRLWVVDLDGQQYVRAGHTGAGWYAAAVAAPSVRVLRGGQEADYRLEAAPTARARVAEAMLAKYGWRERYIATLVGGREGAMPLRLQRTP